MKLTLAIKNPDKETADHFRDNQPVFEYNIHNHKGQGWAVSNENENRYLTFEIKKNKTKTQEET